MRKLLTFTAYTLLLAVITLFSCQKELDCYDCNQPPIANAGADEKITLPKDSVLLDGSASVDPDGKINGWSWTKISGPASSTINSASGAITIVKNLNEGIYRFELKVTDDKGLSAKDTVQIIVDNPAVNQPPVANAGSDQSIKLPKDSVLLNGDQSIDPDNNITNYFWTKISGPSSSRIVNATAVQTTVKDLTQGVYLFELKVTDAGGLFSKDTVQVIVTDPTVNQPPVACAGSDQTITLPNTLILDATCSSDPDNDITGYNWTKILGPSSLSITNAKAAKTLVTNLVQGVYLFQIEVTDAGGLFSKDTLQITVGVDALVSCDLTGRPVINATVTEIGRLSEPRIPAVGAAGNKIVYAGGWSGVYCPIKYYKSSSAVDIYDRSIQTWTTSQLSNSRGDIAVASIGTKILFAGGVNWENYQSLQWQGSYDNVDIYDASNNTWSLAHLSKAREGMCAVVIGNKVIFAGGTYFTKNPLFTNPMGNGSDAVDIYDASTNSWSIAKLSSERTVISAVVIGSNVYFTGGAGFGNAENSNIVDVYNSSTNTWSTSTLPEDVALKDSYQIANYITWSRNNQVKIKSTTTGSTVNYCVSDYVFGAPLLKNNVVAFPTGSNGSSSITQLDLFNTHTNSWSILKMSQNMPGTINANAISVNNVVYLAGGAHSSGGCEMTFYDKVYTINW